MTVLSKEWADGSGEALNVSESAGTGTADVALSSAANNGIDRSITLTAATEGGAVAVGLDVTQEGLREIFNASDGGFLLADGTTFNVLKS